MNEVAVIEQQQTGLVRPAGTPRDIAQAISDYKNIQNELDKALPDCIQNIAGKNFRKKNYWRAVKTAFNLNVFCIKEEKVSYSEGDWGFLVTYRATAPNGASADGDGACTYNEKSKGNMQATVHNIRSQAHTRAFNRAVSNLVGFGEVSAEEIIEEKEKTTKAPTQQPEPEKKKGLPTQTHKDAWKMLLDVYEKDTEKIKLAIEEITQKKSLFACSEEEAKKVIDKLTELKQEDF